jgi:hypothetical protein
MRISELCSNATRIAIYGLAKNTGKTVTLTALINELGERRCVVGITSIGRDGEARDVIDEAIKKPLIRAPAGTLVATTHLLLKGSGLRHDLLVTTPYRNPLGTVVIARLAESGVLEVAGPSLAGQIRDVIERMLSLGAEKVLVDGAINRRCASSPAICDAVIIATGAALGPSLERVVSETAEEAKRVMLPSLRDSRVARHLDRYRGNFMITERGDCVPLDDGFGLTGRGARLSELIASFGAIDSIVMHGAVCESFLQSLPQAGAVVGPVSVVASDSSKFYLNGKAVSWFEKRGIHLRVVNATKLCAITVNPVAPLSHRFDSSELVRRLTASLSLTTVRDVLHESYRRALPADSPPVGAVQCN